MQAMPGQAEEMISRIKKLAADGFGELTTYRPLDRYEVPAIKTADPSACVAEAEARGIHNTSIWLAGVNSVVCFHSVLGRAIDEGPRI